MYGDALKDVFPVNDQVEDTVDDPSRVLKEGSVRADDYVEKIADRRVAPDADAVARLSALDALPAHPVEPERVIALLDEIASPATMGTAGPRFFGFVIGGALPATLAANRLASAWDQNAYSHASSPAAAHVEEVALSWLVDLLGLPAGTGGGFVTGGTMANFTCLAAARRSVLQRAGWDVEAQGLNGAPPLQVVVGEEVHPSMLKALGLLGLGRERVRRVPVDHQGRMRADSLPELDASTIVCAQAGNVNTGAFDPLPEITEAARAAGAWVHVDGAFGLWAAAAPGRRHLVRGAPDADSWALDAHKWLNVPYDSGLALTRHPDVMQQAFAAGAAYLPEAGGREPNHYVPEMSRRARGVETWAALASLGRSGVADLVERCCRFAERFVDGFRDAGHEVLNDVDLNQVLVSFGSPEVTRRVIQEIQSDGTCWCGGTTWQGRTAMRVSVSSWRTTKNDVEASLDAILKAAARHSERRSSTA